MSKRLALALLGLAVVSACAPQSAQQSPVVAPSPSVAPTPNATATARPPNRSDDLLLIRAAQKLRLVSAKTGDQLREWPDGILVDEAKAVYVAVPLAGATKVARIDLATGQELRAITFDGHYVLRYLYDGPGGLSPNGRWLTLVDPNVCQQSFGSAPPPTPQPCVSRYTILDTALDRQPRRVELQGNLWIEAISTDGRSLYLRENLPPQQPSDQHLRIYDLERRTLVPGDVPTAGGAPPTYTYGHTGPEVFSPDGKVRYTLYPFSGDVSAPMVHVLDLDGRSVRRITLPTWSFTPNEEASAWTQLLSPDGATLYAVNGMIGAFIAIDTATNTIRRATKLDSKAANEDGFVAALLRWFFPIAEAKRFIRGAAQLSPDGRTIYALADTGIVVVDAETFALTRRLGAACPALPCSRDELRFDGLALSGDGARLYAVSDLFLKVAILDTTSGASLGELRMADYPVIVGIQQP